MLSGRILVVSDREEVLAELDPIIRAEGHLTLSVPGGVEALSVLEDGIIPDLVVTDLASGASLEDITYLSRFRQLNQLGRHLVVAEKGAPCTDRPAGVLHHPFDEERVRGTIAGAMEEIRRELQSVRAEIFRETARLQRAIREAQLEMVTALAVTMEAKDPYMRGHCARVAELCRRVAAELGVGEEDCERLHTAALLHEIGKVGVSTDLPQRNTALTREELDQVRAHSRVGAQIVGAVPSLRSLVPLIENQYTHYADLPARIDPGTPEFLLAAILHVVDAYDAMISDRSYRSPLPRARWEAELRSGAGSLFHPDAVRALFTVERP